MFRFEVCANGVESCLAAQAGGADRVELCAGIPEGGTTPSYGEIKTARKLLTKTRLISNLTKARKPQLTNRTPTKAPRLSCTISLPS